ncbi:methyl-accepting chemotaxis protein [Pseudoalteromonas aurantia]|uniref:methyl-accepting chemotaxis protein n=1 Tax=Pseudoalteromonas aurantia TaxID=43654 RepID=UPI003D80A6E8
MEAARAGEARRGFAVVADEVRSFASKTQQSTLSITSVINNLQSAAQNAVSAMQEMAQMTHLNNQQSNITESLQQTLLQLN